MCGIVGYVGHRQAAEVLLQGLERLEYRGYDSAGIAVFTPHGVAVEKSAGRLCALRAQLKQTGMPSGSVGIGHTRWATHGAPTAQNAHPHRCGAVTLVHNGIIENHAALRQRLTREGVCLQSDTDTECIAALLAQKYCGDPLAALREVCGELEGSYALAVLFDDHPHSIYAVRRQSPLIVGFGDGEWLLASDIPAVLPHTRRYCPVEEGELCVLEPTGVRFFTADGCELCKLPQTADAAVYHAEKNGHAHFMHKEIHEQPEALRRTVEACLCDGPEGLFSAQLARLGTVKRLHVVACGSALHAGMVGRSAIEQNARIPVCVQTAGEFRYCDPILLPGDAVILISQSGETADTVAALRLAKSRGVPTLAIVNAPMSTLAREADSVILTAAGPEVAVATTKAYLCQTAVLLMLAVKLAVLRERMSAETARKLLHGLSELPQTLQKALQREGEAAALAARYCNCTDAYFIGRGIDHDVCAEASLKLKEVSYVHSEAYAAAELKHGTISLITQSTPVFGLLTQPHTRQKTMANLSEVRARGAEVIAVGPFETCPDGCDALLKTEDADPYFSPISAIIPLQLFAYHIALQKGCDVDKPRNLAKSVTVE
ncbi:MAG: glutamine--fructose-6-phosphate transaminase (isomerizing) [Clostridia bacterium]|nr:glutamine--fructose-6-phosphate transaminase (isomerizing) [Clostridia bacterium]